MRTSSSLHSSAGPLRRIPQAVGAIATKKLSYMLTSLLASFNTASGKYCYFITFVFPSLWSGTRDVRTPSSLCSSVPRTLRRIPQAVSTVATYILYLQWCVNYCFNTASGKYCCNTVSAAPPWVRQFRFNTVNGKYCCNLLEMVIITKVNTGSFNTVNGKYCCNCSRR